jgi:oligopeptide/dipeptide ABC transporter ATP-binding protein
MTEAVLEVEDLEVHYQTPTGSAVAVNGVSFQVFPGETLGLVGESGCGKSTTAMALLNLVNAPGFIVGGSVRLKGQDLTKLSGRAIRKVRWRDVALIPQGAMNSLNPVVRIHQQIAEVILEHEGRQGANGLEERIAELLSFVGLPRRVMQLYPHELSGGMKQRVCIAMAIALHPALLVADEPTSALDVVVQRVVAQTLLDVKTRLGVAVVLIGHDIALQAQLVDRMAVMYAGSILEIGPIESMFDNPRHPYTQLLISSVPSITERTRRPAESAVREVQHRPSGCVFRLRCPMAFERCAQEMPAPRELASGHLVACHLYPADGEQAAPIEVGNHA